MPASVEVFTTGTTLPAYHRAALAAARRIEVGASVIAPAGVVVARTAAEAATRAAARPGRRAWRHPHPSIRRPPRAVRSRRCPPPRGPGRPPAGRSPAARGTDTAALFVVPSPDEITALPGAPRRAARRRRSEAGGTAEPAFAGGPATSTGTGSADGGERRPVDAHRSCRSHRCRTCGRRARHRPVPRPAAGSAAGAAARSHGPGSRRTGLPASGPHPDPSRARAAGDRPNPGGCAGVESVEATSRTGRVETRRARSAEPADPPSDPGSGSVEPTGIEPDVPAGGRQRHTDDQPSGTHPAGHGRRGGGRRRVRAGIRGAGRARVGRLGRRAAGVGGRLAVR